MSWGHPSEGGVSPFPVHSYGFAADFDRIKEQLQDLKVAYREVNIDRDKKAREVMMDIYFRL